MKLGLDFDGVLARELRLPAWLPAFLVRWLLVFAPAVEGIEIARELARKHQLVIVSSRPEKCRFVTRLWLWLHRVPHVALHLVGLKGNKVPVLLKEQVECFFDDKPRYVEAANRQRVTSHRFQSWSQTAELLGSAEIAQELGLVHRLVSSSQIGKWVKRELKRGLGALASRSQKLQALRAELSSLALCYRGTVGREEVAFRKLTRPLVAYHATSKQGARDIFPKGLVPKKTLGQEKEQTPVVFCYLDRSVTWAFSLLGRFPLRLLFSFRSEPRTVILEAILPAGTRVGITSSHELVVLDAILPENLRNRNGPAPAGVGQAKGMGDENPVS